MPRISYRLFFVLLFASLALFLADRKNFLYWPRLGVQTVINPVEYGIYTTRIWAGDSVSFLTFWRSGEERIKNLEQKNWELNSKLVLLNAVLAENKSLRLQLGAKSTQGKKMIPARVLGVSSMMEIGAGQIDGVQKGMTVAYVDNLIGRVEKVLPHSAFVILPTDGYSMVPVAIGTVRAVAAGSFGSQITLQKVGQTDQIQKDDLVVTSGEGDSYFPGLIVGRISKITGKETDLFRQAEVTQLFDSGKLDTVFVIYF